MSVISKIKSEVVKDCIADTYNVLNSYYVDKKSVKLTLISLIKFGLLNTDKSMPKERNDVLDSLVRSGAYHFGPMFTASHSTNAPRALILRELTSKGFYVGSLSKFNDAQLNLFFITLKSSGLVTDRYFNGYLTYSGA